MNTRLTALLLPALLAVCLSQVNAQSSPVDKLFPKGAVFHRNLSYANDTLSKHLLDIYLPEKMQGAAPLIVWIHGGAWMLNDKYADMNYMANTVKGFIDSGYALASIDYRFSTQAAFPAQIQDCNQAMEYLYQHAGQYHYDKNRIAVIGFSAGGHLASLLALSENNNVAAFFPPKVTRHFHVKCLLDFYGPADLVAFATMPNLTVYPLPSSIELLLGADPLIRPDLARTASPANYVDSHDPPAIIVQGEKDSSVPNTQSKLLAGWLSIAGVTNQLIIVPNAPHYGPMFDAPDIRRQVFRFLNDHLR